MALILAEVFDEMPCLTILLLDKYDGSIERGVGNGKVKCFLDKAVHE